MRILLAATLVALTATAHADTVKLENTGMTLELPDGTTWVAIPTKSLEAIAPGPTDAVGKGGGNVFLVVKMTGSCVVGEAHIAAKGLTPLASSVPTEEQKSRGWIAIGTGGFTFACIDRGSPLESVAIIASKEIAADIELFRIFLDAVGTARFGAAYSETKWLDEYYQRAESPKADPEPKPEPEPNVPRPAGSELMFAVHAGLSTSKRTDPRISRGSGLLVGYEFAMRGTGVVSYATDSGLALGYAYGSMLLDVRFGLGLAVSSKTFAVMITGGAILSFLGEEDETDGFTRHAGAYGTARVLYGSGDYTASAAVTQTGGSNIDQRRYDVTVGIKRIFVTARLIDHAELGESVVARTVQLAAGLGGSF